MSKMNVQYENQDEQTVVGSIKYNLKHFSESSFSPFEAHLTSLKTRITQKKNQQQKDSKKTNQQLEKEIEEFEKVQEFLKQMTEQERSSKSAKYYLSQNGWDLQSAIWEYKKDLQWQNNYKQGSMKKKINKRNEFDN